MTARSHFTVPGLLVLFTWTVSSLSIFQPIQSSEPAHLLNICELQGRGSSSPYSGQAVSTRGVVFADFDQSSQRGFFLQQENCDDDPATSDGIFVYLGERLDVVQPGDLVEVSGTVHEYYGLTEIVAPPDSITVLGRDSVLPSPQELDPPPDPVAARAYLEAAESMYVQIPAAVVVGPTDADDRTRVVHQSRGVNRVFEGSPDNSGLILCLDDGGLYEVSPEAAVGDRLLNLAGPLDFDFGEYCLQLLAQPEWFPSGKELPESPTFLPGAISAATFNLANLFDTLDDPDIEDSVLSGTEYQRRLQKRALAIHEFLGEPDILAVQEAENLNVLLDMVQRPEIQVDYKAILVDGPDSRGIDTGLLYRADRAAVLDYQSRQGCTSLVDGLGPDGNQDMSDPQNDLTCDRDGDGVVDGNRLFSRPPLAVHLMACSQGCKNDPVNELWVVTVHLKSKTQDTTDQAYTLPRRLEQTGFLIDLVSELQACYPEAGVLLLGDFNDTLASQPLSLLKAAGLESLAERIAAGRRYTYNYHGLSQVLDHAILKPALLPGGKEQLIAFGVQAVAIDSDYPVNLSGESETALRSSDHDPLLIQLAVLKKTTYLPLALR